METLATTNHSRHPLRQFSKTTIKKASKIAIRWLVKKDGPLWKRKRQQIITWIRRLRIIITPIIFMWVSTTRTQIMQTRRKCRGSRIMWRCCSILQIIKWRTTPRTTPASTNAALPIQLTHLASTIATMPPSPQQTTPRRNIPTTKNTVPAAPPPSSTAAAKQSWRHQTTQQSLETQINQLHGQIRKIKIDGWGESNKQTKLRNLNEITSKLKQFYKKINHVAKNVKNKHFLSYNELNLIRI